MVTGGLILTLVGLTSAGAYLVTRRGFRLSGGQFLPAIGKMLEGIGMGLVFFIINVLTAAFLFLALRRLTGTFVSVYEAKDLSLPVLSLLQGLAFHWWREVSSRSQHA